MAQYCRSGKQTKAYRISVIYFAPQIEKGIPLNQAAKEQRNIADQKNILLKELFFLLGNDKTDNPYIHKADSASLHPQPTVFSLQFSAFG